MVRHLEAGEGGTEAEAWASAKREVPSGAAGQVQLLRHGESERVAVGLLNVHQDRSAGSDALSAELMVSYGGPAGDPVCRSTAVTAHRQNQTTVARALTDAEQVGYMLRTIKGLPALGSTPNGGPP